MKNKHKDLRDFALTGLGLMSAAMGTAFVVAELPAIVVAGAGVIIAGGALRRLDARGTTVCCDDANTPECDCDD